MTVPQVFRASGLTLAVGAAAFIAHIVARSVITANAGGDTLIFAAQSAWVPINALGAFGAALVLLGLPAMYARTGGVTGRVGLIGVVLIALGWMIVGWFLSLYSMLVVPWLASQAPTLVDAITQDVSLLIVFVSGQLAVFLGMVLLAIPFVQGRVRPRWVAAFLLVAALMMIVGDLVAPAGPATNVALNLFSNLSPVLMMSAFLVLGLQMWLEHADTGQTGAFGHSSASGAMAPR